MHGLVQLKAGKKSYVSASEHANGSKTAEAAAGVSLLQCHECSSLHLDSIATAVALVCPVRHNCIKHNCISCLLCLCACLIKQTPVLALLQPASSHMQVAIGAVQLDRL